MAHLIVIESDEELRQLIGFVLSDSGHDVVAEEESIAKLDPVKLGRVDLVLCDVGFLDASDLARVAEVKRLFPDAKIIGTSAGIHEIDSDKWAETANQAGLVEILSKPFSIEALLKAVS